MPLGWHSLLREPGKMPAQSISLSATDFQEIQLRLGRDMSVLSDMDWMLGGAQTFLKGLRDSVQGRQEDDSLDDSLYFLQRYLLEISQDVGHLALSSTALFANLRWRERDQALTRCHTLLSDSRESLRRGPLLSKTLFEENMVTAAASRLQGDISSQTNTKMLERLSAPPVANKLAKNRTMHLKRSSAPMVPPPAKRPSTQAFQAVGYSRRGKALNKPRGGRGRARGGRGAST